MARKPLSDARKSETPLRIRLTETERALIQEAATKAGMPESTWARGHLIELAQKELSARKK